MKHERDEHDVNLALLKPPTILGFHAGYIVGGFAVTCILGAHFAGHSKLVGVLLFMAVESLAIWFSRDPMRLPISILSLRHKRAYCPLKRARC